MHYVRKIKYSFAKFWQNPSLLSVLLLNFIMTVLVGILFVFVDIMILAALNQGAMAMMQQFDWHLLVNPKTMAVGAILLIIQGFIFVYLDSFFKAGFYGMLKNLIHDGSTVFDEFMPGAKRYWHAMFRFLMLRYAILFLITLPFIVSFLFYQWTTPLLRTPMLNLVVLVTFFFGFLFGLIAFFILQWGEAAIVFEDATAMQAIKISLVLVKKNLSKAFNALFTFLWVVALSIILASLISTFFEVIAPRLPPEPGFERGPMTPGWQIFTGIVDFLLNVLTLVATIVGSIYFFLLYYEITTGKTKVVKVEKKKAKKQ